MPSIKILNSQIKRLNTEVTDLNKKIGEEKKKEAISIMKRNKAQSKLLKANSQTAINSASREIESANRDYERALKNQSDLMVKLARKSADLAKKKEDLVKEQKKESDKVLQAQQVQGKKMLEVQNRIQQQLDSHPLVSTLNYASKEEKKYDVFISHASEDKDNFVRPLVEALQQEGIKVWYDEDSIAWGTSIRQSIDRGLANSRFGLVVISKLFLDKYWTNYEMDGLFHKEARNGQKVLLPIWHHVTKNEVLEKSPSLADRQALNSSIQSIDEIVEAVKGQLEVDLADNQTA